MVVTSFPTLALPAPSRDAVAEEPSALESGPLSEEAAAAPSPAASPAGDISITRMVQDPRMKRGRLPDAMWKHRAGIPYMRAVESFDPPERSCLGFHRQTKPHWCGPKVGDRPGADMSAGLAFRPDEVFPEDEDEDSRVEESVSGASRSMRARLRTAYGMSSAKGSGQSRLDPSSFRCASISTYWSPFCRSEMSAPGGRSPAVTADLVTSDSYANVKAECEARLLQVPVDEKVDLVAGDRHPGRVLLPPLSSPAYGY